MSPCDGRVAAGPADVVRAVRQFPVERMQMRRICRIGRRSTTQAARLSGSCQSDSRECRPSVRPSVLVPAINDTAANRLSSKFRQARYLTSATLHGRTRPRVTSLFATIEGGGGGGGRHILPRLIDAVITFVAAAAAAATAAAAASSASARCCTTPLDRFDTVIPVRAATTFSLTEI